MKNTKTLYIGIIILVAIAGYIFYTIKKKEALIKANPPIEKLLFVKKTGEEFAPEQQKSINEYKAKILVRARLGVKLTEKEKENFAVFISDKAIPFPNGDMVANQSVLQFSSEEIQMLSQAILND